MELLVVENDGQQAQRGAFSTEVQDFQCGRGWSDLYTDLVKLWDNRKPAGIPIPGREVLLYTTVGHGLQVPCCKSGTL